MCGRFRARAPFSEAGKGLSSHFLLSLLPPPISLSLLSKTPVSPSGDEEYHAEYRVRPVGGAKIEVEISDA